MFQDFVSNALSQNDFNRLKKVIEKESGIKMPPIKIKMLEARLRKRLKLLNMNSYSEYCEFLFNNHGNSEELIHMLDVTTTNKTDFFREPKHFEFLSGIALNYITSHYKINSVNPIKIWSAGCSTGEEPYTLGMVLSEYKKNSLGFDYNVYATDISTQVLETAKQAIYENERIVPVDYELMKKYFLKSKNPDKKIVRVVPEIRNRVRYERVNFITDNFQLKGKFHIIFCRNVMIYFDKENQKKLINKFYNSLENGGYLFIGHSETILNTDLSLTQKAPSVYQKAE